MTEELLGYLAGFFDGEGCVTYRLDRRPNRVRRLLIEAKISGVDPKPLELFSKYIGGNVRKRPKLTSGGKPWYMWRLASLKRLKTFLKIMEELSLVKKKRIQEALLILKEYDRIDWKSRTVEAIRDRKAFGERFIRRVTGEAIKGKTYRLCSS